MNIFSKNLTPARLAAELKGKCVEYASNYLGEDFWQSEFGKKLAEKTQDSHTNEKLFVDGWIQYMDNFILFGETEDGQNVLDHIISNAKLRRQEKEILGQWGERAFPSIFEIKEVAPGKVRAGDVAAEVDYEISFNDPAQGREFTQSLPIGSFVQSNILPVENIWFFSGMQIVLPASSEPDIFQSFITKASARQAFRNNPEKLQRALEAQKKHYRIFVDTFGTDELIVPPQQVRERLRKYYDKLSASSGQLSKITIPQLPADFQSAETIGIVMDEREGQHEFVDYGKFMNIFETGNISKKAREFVMDYLEDESLPAFVFRRMKHRYQKNFHKVILEATARTDRRIYPVKDFDRLMDIFKPNWRETYPAIIPLNQRFEKYYYRLGRNDVCYCGSKEKFKKCHGK